MALHTHQYLGQQVLRDPPPAAMQQQDMQVSATGATLPVMYSSHGRPTGESVSKHLEVCLISGEALSNSGRHSQLWRQRGP